MDRRTLLGFIPVSVLALVGAAESQPQHPVALAKKYSARNTNTTCSVCAYFYYPVKGIPNTNGQCRRYPGWVERKQTESCGEFRANQ